MNKAVNIKHTNI